MNLWEETTSSRPSKRGPLLVPETYELDDRQMILKIFIDAQEAKRVWHRSALQGLKHFNRNWVLYLEKETRWVRWLDQNRDNISTHKARQACPAKGGVKRYCDDKAGEQ